MKYFFYNPYTKNSEGPYTIDMLRELVSKEQILPESKLCLQGGQKWVEAAEIGELFGPAPLPNISENDDDFVHPMSKKGVKIQYKKGYKAFGWLFMFMGGSSLFMCISSYFFLGNLFSAFGTNSNYYIYIVPSLGSVIFFLFGFFFLKKSKKINV